MNPSGASRVFVTYASALLRGEKMQPPPFPLPEGAPFYRQVWHVLRTIPRGEVRTYARVAADAGCPGAARAAGTACARNPLPLFIPCHRVVAAHGPGGFGAGLAWKKLLLKNESSSTRKARYSKLKK
ncbi:methylated-DNA--[protein]-cysteine S-methyltransferase [Kiritimatiella glycovorans]|uniref:methylated-DNA--[protein]-cysteine S-methyltransferase n=1 Tax=Kiritimatiella glycovorans TaxID=1307763 RepID=A0A0G3EJD3_9BACT|nr:methylated-DNA--[protein]-cysteine S-methyltransferase [Kiritimatiella glycovorans]AKJ64890.1 Methylated-DNA--protein-cysteine methyltransferase, constitutive [Kiritimatiella glycovorans]